MPIEHNESINRQPIERLAPDPVTDQLVRFINHRHNTLHNQGHRTEGELLKESGFLLDLFGHYIQERNFRAGEIESNKVKVAREIVEGFFPYLTFGAFCVDGRIWPIVALGIPAGYGGFSRTLGGDLSGFKQHKEGGLVLLTGSDTANLLDEYYERHKGVGKPLCQLLDSHVGCAARDMLESRRGNTGKDGGLMEDVLRKKEIAGAMVAYVDVEHPGNEILPIQFSFDPHTGFGYMGLEKDSNIAVAKQEGGYTQEVLKELTGEKKIISTEDIASAIAEDLRPFNFPVDWESRYADSASDFWLRMNMLTGTSVFTRIMEITKSIYNECPPKELEQRAKILLASTFNGYLQNSGPDKKAYPHYEHEESIIVIQEQGYGPFKGIKEFSVFPGRHLSTDSVFASGIIRSNREKGNITDITGHYSADDFFGAPVPAVVKGIVHGEGADAISEDIWTEFAKIDWEDMPEDWHSMNDERFEQWLEEQYKNIPSILTRTVNKLRHRICDLYNGGLNASLLMSEGRITALPIITDKSRRVRAVIPLLHAGY